MFKYKNHRKGSLTIHSPHLYCDARKKFIGDLFDRKMAKDGKLLDDGQKTACSEEYMASMINYISRQYLVVYGEDKYFAQLPKSVLRKFARRKEREEDIKDSIFLWYFKQSKDPLLCGFSYREKKDGKNVGKQKQHEFIKTGIVDAFGPDIVDLDEYIKKSIKREVKNIWSRLKLAMLKGQMNYFNYFVTFTYDDELHTAESFEYQLKTKLKNEAYRRGWAYMGMREFGGDTERKHFHFLMYIPAGEMLGKIEEVEEYCVKRKKMVKRLENTFFRQNFGINTFEAITYAKGTMSPVSYVQKYMSKTDEKMIYSRHVAGYDFVELPDIEPDTLETMRIVMYYHVTQKCSACGEKLKNETNKKVIKCADCGVINLAKEPEKVVRGYILSNTDIYLPTKVPGRFGSKFNLINNLPWGNTA